MAGNLPNRSKELVRIEVGGVASARNMGILSILAPPTAEGEVMTDYIEQIRLTPEENLQCSLISKYPLRDVQDVIEETQAILIDKILSIPITKSGVCPDCRGTKIWEAQCGHYVTCPACKGTGNFTQTKTIGKLIEEYEG